MRARGYQSQPFLNDVIGYAYPNVDSDGDGLIDAFERMIGTREDVADTDCDGFSDGDEVLFYDKSHPDPARHGYGNPLAGGFCLFSDNFETGDVLRWSSSQL